MMISSAINVEVKFNKYVRDNMIEYAEITKIEFSAVKGTGVEQIKAAVEAAITEV